MEENTESHQVVCFGESLWDVLPDQVVIGGSPMNVAYHLKKNGQNPAIISKVGLDETGKVLIQTLEKSGICTDYFQMDFDKDTGKVFVKIKDTNHIVFDIVYPAAWDFIDPMAEQEDLVQQASYFVFGSLITRHNQSKNTLFKLLECANTKVLDINLRPPFYNREILNELLAQANILKMNSLELELLTGWFSKYQCEQERIQSIQDQFKIDTIIVTRKHNGAVLCTSDGYYEHDGYKAAVVDTVGSGDAFLAAIISKFIEQAPPVVALDYACRLSAFISLYTGACPDYTAPEVFSSIPQVAY